MSSPFRKRDTVTLLMDILTYLCKDSPTSKVVR